MTSKVKETSINRASIEMNVLNEPLLSKNNDSGDEEENAEQSLGCWYSFKRYFNMTISRENRKLNVEGVTLPSHFCTNQLNNQKYNLLSFIPKVLYNEFKFFFNMFFLLIAISQFFQFLKVGFLFTYIAPLAFVLVVTMIKEGMDDFNRFRRDKELNNAEYAVLQRSSQGGSMGSIVPITSKDIKVGQIIKIVQGQRVPADLILFKTTERSGGVFIKTDQLDGETDWKLRKAIPFTQRQKDEFLVHNDGDYVLADPPNDQIYKFMGQYVSNSGEQDKEGLSLENTIWANTVLASPGYILGMVVHTGVETRMAMNTSAPRQKTGTLDMEVNWLAKVLFILMVVISALIIAADGFYGDWYFKFFRVILLLCAIIPISMRINLDFAKLFYKYQVESDEEIEGTIARNSTIPEELGRIQFMLSDKTGTLTQNDMIFKKISMEFAQYGEDDIGEMTNQLFNSCHKHGTGPYGEIGNTNTTNPDDSASASGQDQKRKRGRGRGGFGREHHFVVRDLILALSLCHNVTPVYPDGDDQTKKEFQAASPDEIALVKFAEQLDMRLEEREETYIRLKNPDGVTEEYDILQCFPFSSESKRMGIIIKHRDTGKIVFYVKGADVIMAPKVKPGQRSTCQEFCENLSRDGLRTLVITQKLIPEAQYQDFATKLKQAKSSMVNREEEVAKTIMSLEYEMDFLAVTGVEDKLQENVLETIDTLRQAGIQIWMLTGDKIETAKCIAISTGLKNRNEDIKIIAGETEVNRIDKEIDDYENLASTHMLMIDGTTLTVIVANEQLCQKFFNVTQAAKTVCVCRCSPTQKAIVAVNIKEVTGKVIACIGDGGNDVAMIQKADVGLGIVGKEGMQASLAADFSVTRFCDIKKLIIWHGRLSYKRSASLSQFVVHRGMIISFIQAIFTCLYFFVTIPIYNGYLILGYSTIYTSFPVFSLVLDEDVSLRQVNRFPALYKTIQKGRSLNLKTFLIWTWKSIYQACLIMFVAVTQFDQSFVNIVSITFTTLICIEMLNVLSEVTKIQCKMVFSIILTLACYIGSIALFRQYFQVSYIDGPFLLKVTLLTLITWFPLQLFKKVMEKCDPTQEQKIMQEAG